MPLPPELGLGCEHRHPLVLEQLLDRGPGGRVLGKTAPEEIDGQRRKLGGESQRLGCKGIRGGLAKVPLVSH